LGQRNRAYWASKPQKSVTLQPQPGDGWGETTKSERTFGGIGGEKNNFSFLLLVSEGRQCEIW